MIKITFKSGKMIEMDADRFRRSGTFYVYKQDVQIGSFDLDTVESMEVVKEVLAK